jgi:hypothetical protein
METNECIIKSTNPIDAYLFLYECELLKITLQKCHLLLLSLAIAVTDDIVVLLFDFI